MGLAWIKPSKKDMAVTFSYCSEMDLFQFYVFVDIMITQNDHPRYVKHFLVHIHVVFTLFGYWLPRAGGLSSDRCATC